MPSGNTDSCDSRGFRCYYDLLQIDPAVSQAELRRAYRHQALIWHPDKQPTPELATASAEQFRQIQRAYEILSDPRTRAWYDENRQRILRRGGRSKRPPDAGAESAAASVNIFEYFPPGCYRDYSDGPGGFFSVYNGLFDRLAAEFTQSMSTNGMGDSVPPPPMPAFGRSDSDFESVVAPFYSSWEAAAAASANQQSRSEEIRVLIAFVKAWDPRVLNWRLKAASNLITGLAEEEAVRASVGRSVQAGLFVCLGALIGGGLSSSSTSRGGSYGLALGAAFAGAAYALLSWGQFVSLAEALRLMPAEKRTRLAELTLDTMREVNAMDTATWASLIVTDAAFRARLLSQAREFACGKTTHD